jgi:hypothetical protein
MAGRAAVPFFARMWKVENKFSKAIVCGTFVALFADVKADWHVGGARLVHHCQVRIK